MDALTHWNIVPDDSDRYRSLQTAEVAQARVEQLREGLAHAIKARRVKANCSQREFAQIAGISHEAIRRLEDGRKVGMDSFVRALVVMGFADDLVALLSSQNGLSDVDALMPLKRAERKRARKRVQYP